LLGCFDRFSNCSININLNTIEHSIAAP
jgi:hypothetical protein